MKRTRRQCGVTMVELVVVVAIIGVLAAATIITLIGLQTQVKRKAAKDLLLTLDTALDEYHQAVGHYPVIAGVPGTKVSEQLWLELEKVEVSAQILHRINAKYTHDRLVGTTRLRGLIDPWGQYLDYRMESSGYPMLTSSGPDRKLGTGDDITNLEGQS